MNLINGTTVNIGYIESHLRRPTIYQRSTNYIWTDDHVGRQMLQFHLDPDMDSASLKHTTIDEQVAWIAGRAGGRARSDDNVSLSGGDPPALLDIGCGPGLYCERFHDRGFAVTGFDFNKHSLAVARDRADQTERDITYVEGNYLTMDYHEAYDVVTLINRDFGALSVSERDTLIAGVYQALRPGGHFVFDNLSPGYLEKRVAERCDFNASMETGFWCEGPHMVIDQVLIYPEESAELQRQIVIDQEGATKVFHNWLTYYTENQVVEALEQAGFRVLETNPFLSDRTYDDPDLYLGFVAVKP